MDGCGQGFRFGEQGGERCVIWALKKDRNGRGGKKREREGGEAAARS